MAARESQYTDDYLETTASGRLITPGTYLAYTLHGRAKSYSGRYLDSLVRSLCVRGAQPVTSVRGGTAYVLAKGVR